MDDLINRKKAWRASALAARRNLSPNQVQEYSQAITRKLKELEPVKQAQTIMGFFPINNEVDLLPFLKNSAQKGQKILLPRIEKQGNIIAVELTNWEQTCTSQFGIREPLGEQFNMADIDVILVPGLVFDGHGYRLGYGKGYYDRFLGNSANRAFKCGVCFEFQVIDNVIPHQNDIPLHWIVTEKSELGIDWTYF